MKKNKSLHNQNKKFHEKKVLNMKRFVLIFKILLPLFLLVALTSVGCDERNEWAEVSKDKVVVGEPLKLSVHTREGDTFGCAKSYHESVAGKYYKWSVKPSDGATVKDGVFVASKPGKYNVTPVGKITNNPSSVTITVQGTAIETMAAETAAAETTVFTYISLSDGIISDPINSSEADFFAKLTLEQGIVDSSGGYYLGGEQSVEGCTGTMSGIYDPKTRQFTGKYWDQVSIPTIDKPDEEYIMNGTFSEVIGHTGKVTIKVEGTQYHRKLNYEEDENGIWLYKDHIEWSETIDSSSEVTFTVTGLD